MKKNIFTIAILALGLSNANAQKGVGINTTTPTETLHVKGTFRLENADAGNGKILVSDADGKGTWTTITTNPGTVTNFSAGDLAPLFTTTENTTTTTPELNFTLTNAGANTILGNNTAATAAPSYFSAANLPLAGNVTGTLGATVVNTIPATADTSDWKLTGNTTTSGAGTLGTASTNYIGTKDAKTLAFATNNITRAILGTDGSLNGGGGTLNSFSWGTNNTASGTTSVALGTGNNAIGNNSIAIGSNNSASSTNSIAIGYDAAGTNNTNSGSYSMALGYGNTVSGQKNFVLGLRNVITSSNTGISFQGGTFVLGNDNSVPSVNTTVIGGSNFTNQSGMVIGDRNGTLSNPIGSGYTVGTNNTSNSGGYIFGSQNGIIGASSGSMVLGNNGTISGKSFNTVYSNDIHYFKSTATNTKTIVGINIDPSTFIPGGSAIQSDITVNTSIRIVPQTPNSSCDPASEGAIRYNATTKKHQGCDGSTWQNLY